MWNAVWNRGSASSDTSQGNDADLSTSGPGGVKVLSNPEDANIDICFVHGLTGNRETTWTCGRVLWPRDLLPSDIPSARIMTWGYDADIIHFGISVAGSNTLRDHGKNLATDIAMWRERSQTNRLRPIIFVAHSLGGLVVEQALMISRGATEVYLAAVLEATYGIIFMGTPHMGTDLAKWGLLLQRMGSMLRKSNQELVAVLEPNSEMLANIQQEFHSMREQRRTHGEKLMKLYCFYEELAILGLGGKIVPDHSAILSPNENAAIHGTHTSMTKFVDTDDLGYTRVSGQLWLWVTDSQNPDAPQSYATQSRRRDDDEVREERRGTRRLEFNGAVSSGGGPVFQGSFNNRGNMNVYGRRN